MRVRLALAGVLILLPTPAQAAGPKVTWPEQRSYAPGETVSVKVASRERVRAALVRQSASGKVMRTVARRTLRSGRFAAKLPSAGRYALRVGARSRTITVTAPSEPASSGPLPPVEAPQLPGCTSPTGDRAELRLAATSVPAGGTLPIEVVNTSTGCLLLGVGYSFERLQDGVWVSVPSGGVFPSVGVILPPGKTYAKQAVVPADAVPGTYRVLDRISGAAPIDLAAQFEVTGA